MSSPASSGPAPAGAQSLDQAGGGGLLSGALRFRDTLVMSLASSGPTQSIAVTLAALLATVGYASFLPLVICFIPMLGIAIGYQRLNAWQPSAGATYSWVGRALNPHAGFFSGWIMLMYYCVGTTSLTVQRGMPFLAMPFKEFLSLLFLRLMGASFFTISLYDPLPSPETLSRLTLCLLVVSPIALGRLPLWKTRQNKSLRGC